MQVDFALLAAYAESTPDGSLNIMKGGLDAIRVGRPPATVVGTQIPVFGVYLVGRLRFQAEESDRDYRLRIELIAEETIPAILLQEIPIHPPPTPTVAKLSLVAFITPPNNVAPGDYQLRIRVDEQVLKNIPLSVQAQPGSP
jgi:hypothetical protein